MKQILVEHSLPSGPRPLLIEFAMEQVATKSVPLNLMATRKACSSCGAFGKNWGCPPFAPDFTRIARENLMLVCAKVATDSYPKTVLTSHFGVKMLFAETFLKPMADRFGRELAEIENGLLLSSGSCRVCPKCAKKDGLPCRKPTSRTNSLESTGVLVTDLVKSTFGFDLDWWSRTHTPKFACKVIGITF